MSIHFNAPGIRRGLSFIEFIGCLSAVAGGIVLGCVYYGVDVKEAAVGALRYAEALPATNEAPPTADVSATPATNVDAKTSSATAAAPAASAATAEPSPAEAITLTREQRAELTRDYWEALNAHMKTEADQRAAQSEGGVGIHDYLSRRSEGHRTAAASIAALNHRGVDGHVSAYAKRVLAWHEEGAAMFARAKDLVTDAPTAQFSGPFAQEWQNGVTQHQMEERLLGEKHAAVQLYLDHAAKD